MARVRVATVIDAPRDVVWAALRDIRSHVRWMEDAEAIRITSLRDSGVGTSFECDTRVGPFRLLDRMVVTAWRERREMGVRHDGLVTGEGRFTLRRAGLRRTRFVWEEELTFPRWLGGPVGAAASTVVLRRVWRKNLANLKRMIESGSL